jgi:hypothetical protein
MANPGIANTLRFQHSAVILKIIRDDNALPVVERLRQNGANRFREHGLRAICRYDDGNEHASCVAMVQRKEGSGAWVMVNG